MQKFYFHWPFIVFVFFVFVAAILDFLGSVSYYFNFEGKNIFIPYYSDRNVVPFPLLFKEFDLSHPGSLRSGVRRGRDSEEPCSRRLLLEYENYRLNKDNIFENVAKKGFVAPKGSPPGWLSYTPVDKLVLTLLDAYRFDYVIEDPLLKEDSKDLRNIYTNNMKHFYSLMKEPESRDHDRLYKLISSYPTLTTFAVKGILSGDTRNVRMVSENSSPSDLKLDHLPHQLNSNNLEINLLGDVTAYDMAPHSFKTSITNKHYNTVNDIYNADQIVYENYKRYLDRSDVFLLHLVAADHLSHCGGRNTSEMKEIMTKYNHFTKDLMEECKKYKNHMMFFFGDHGQKESGTHGDTSVEEVETFLLVHSDMKMNSTEKDYCPISETPKSYRAYHSALNGKVDLDLTYRQHYTKDICTTASLLMNVPIPFHSEGSLIATSVPLITDRKGNIDWALSEKYVVQLHHVNVHHLLRIVDILSENKEVKLNKEKYEDILSDRVKLANLYTILRLVDTSPNSKFEKVKELYENYVNLCKTLGEKSSELATNSTKSFTFHYLYVSIIIKYVAIVILGYCLLGTLKYFKMGKKVRDQELDKKVEEQIVKRAALRLVRSLMSSLALSLIMGLEFKRKFNFYFFKLNLTWPVGPFKVSLKVMQKFTNFLSSFFLIEEYTIYLHFTLLYALFLTVFLLYDTPMLYTGYKYLLSEEYTAKDEKKRKSMFYASSLKTFAYNVGKYSLRKVTLVLYTVIIILVVLSECALYSHDTISRHLVVIFMLIETVPFLLRDRESYLFKKVGNSLVLLFVVLKISSFFHDYRLFFYSSDLPTATWLKVDKFLNLFEVEAASLAAYYVLLMGFMKKYNESQIKDSKDHFEFCMASCSKTFKKKKFMMAVYTVNFASVLVNFGLNTKSSLLGLNRFIHSLHNAYNIKMFVSTIFAWIVLVLVVLTFSLLMVNPYHMFFDKNQNYRFSSFLFFTIPNFCFLIFLVQGQRKSLPFLLGLIMMYQICVILISKNSNFYLSHSLLLQTVADSIYFARGSIDKLFDLNFEAGFVFITNYFSPISDPTIGFDVVCLHILFTKVIMFTYFNTASLKYDLLDEKQALEAGLGSFELHTTDRFETYLTKSINEEFKLESNPNELTRKQFTLVKIIHVITLFITVVSVLGFSLLTVTMKLQYMPVIALRSFTKVLFILIRSTSILVTQLFFFAMRSFI